MNFKLNLSQPKKLEPETVAINFVNTVRKNCYRYWLKIQTCNPNIRKEIHKLRDQYNCNRGSAYSYNRLIQRANRINRKLLEIASYNPEDWSNYRRGQQFRRLDELLADFEVECSRLRRSPEPQDNVLPFPK